MKPYRILTEVLRGGEWLLIEQSSSESGRARLQHKRYDHPIRQARFPGHLRTRVLSIDGVALAQYLS